MSSKKPTYEELRHKLDSDMLQASSLPTKPQRQGFVNRTFIALNKSYQDKQVNHSDYVKLINRLAAYKAGEFNDYIDILAGAAQLNMLELAIQGELSELSPDAAAKRSQSITDLTGMKPSITHEKEEE
jgi:hypothetical protein